MKTTDLRLGNYIDKYGKPTKVDLGILQKIENGSVIYKPIPLSEKWLLKLDFQKRDVEFPSYTKKGIQINYLIGWNMFAELRLKQSTNSKTFFIAYLALI